MYRCMEFTNFILYQVIRVRLLLFSVRLYLMRIICDAILLEKLFRCKHKIIPRKNILHSEDFRMSEAGLPRLFQHYPGEEMAEPPCKQYQKYPKFTELNNLAASTVGSKILFATDDWFATAENLLNVVRPIWKEGVFTEFGKWMDGWESRRKRIPGHDWCIIQLGVPGVIEGVDVDTSYFTGNYAPRMSIQAACLHKVYPGRKARMGTAATPEDFKFAESLDSEVWETIVPLDLLNPGYKTSCHNFFPCKSKKRYTHLRLNIHPDGGVARLRVYGRSKPEWSKISPRQLIDLVSMEMGGMLVASSNVHYGHARNLIQPGRGVNMGDGWETARHPNRPTVLQDNAQGILQVSGTDWCVFRLGHPGTIRKIEVDTYHFKGNFPDSCKIEGCNIDESKEKEALKSFGKNPWKILLPSKKLSANSLHVYDGAALKDVGVISHVRLTIAPDGGISRLRILGNRDVRLGVFEMRDSHTIAKL